MSAEDSAGKICPHCEGRGWVVEDDGGAGTARPCACQRETMGPRLLETAGVPPRYRECTFRAFKTRGESEAESQQLLAAKSVAERYVEDFLGEGGFTTHGLLFVGAPGAGKTHLAVSVLTELIRRYRVRGLFVDFTTLIHQIQSTFDPASGGSKQKLLDPVTRAEFLVLDELGAQKPSAWVREILYLVMNSRYSRRLPTVFTTNYSLGSPAAATNSAGGAVGTTNLDRPPPVRGPELLEHRIGPSLMSRLYEMARPVEIHVQDFRQVVKRQSHSFQPI